ncbi:hypothetical protein Acy02nite_13860 [Actinoplanes cyaneus]|uniref:Tetratricopeptide repeat protein n=1 Tax=Actinoplanes cyaneus TaxID=52696 RepID=A0A919IKA9_9ACTN|nr:tetratricopeptide repeat protein [Actinoplanes cyaneus]MCW2137456.1 Tetratricopeptide repeat-containing protein [Actinoplanes cyaneus]GID63505.1 hypothetical protein Acy02nite_13860 [Actinoplanes cyaneus]
MPDETGVTGDHDQATAVRLELAERVVGIEQWDPDAPIPSVALIETFRELAAADPAYRSGVPLMVIAASRHLGSVGRVDAALPPAGEAVTLARELGDEPTVATAVDNLALWLARSGRPAGRGMGLRERLSETYGSRFLPDLMLSLNTESTALARSGRLEEALAAGERCTAVARATAGADPEYRDQLAAALSDLSALLARSNRPAEAMRAAKESLALYQMLDRETGGYRGDVIAGLREVAARYQEQGKSFRAQIFARQAAAMAQGGS